MSISHQIDQLCDEFEAAWSSEERPAIQEFLLRIAAKHRLPLLKQLIPVDVECRIRYTTPPVASNYALLGERAEEIAAEAIARIADQTNGVNPSEAAVEQTLIGKDSDAAADEARLTESQLLDSFHKVTKPTGSSPVIGPYKILQKIGEGGMGNVFMAEQTLPVRRRVALKLIKAGMDSKDVITRFEAERQALALMDHPHIAKVLDAGTTKDGRPYFVMELVQGIPITEYCDKNKLSIEDRLELFTQTCRAIQHAHQKGIIHRDIKPSNVLVTQHDGVPFVKVIDFGLAKALQFANRLTDKTMFTEFGQVLGTFQYMSPEQAEMNALDVDTRSDVYSLGVLLYELLTGSTPIEKQRLKEMALDRVLVAIREEEAPRPSMRLSSIGDSATGISNQRRTDPRKLSLILKGDLDWIAMKALEKDRTRRYENASQFAEDIRRYVKQEPVTARPPSMAYWLKKMALRHKVAISVSIATICLLLAGITGTTWQMFRAWRAEQVADNKTIEALVEAKNARDAKATAETMLARSKFALALARWEAGRVREANDLLENIPPEFRRLEWFIAKRQFIGCDYSFPAHATTIQSVVFHPDGHEIAAGAGDGTITFWNLSGSLVRTLRGHTDTVQSICFSRDGMKLVSGSEDGTIRIWDSNTGRELSQFSGSNGPIHSVRLSYDNKLIASIGDGETVTIWDAETGTEIRHLSATYTDMDAETQQLSPKSLAFDADSHRIAAGLDQQTFKVWNSENGTDVKTMSCEVSFNVLAPISAISFSPDEKTLVVGGHRSLIIYDAESLSVIRDIEFGKGNITSIAFRPNTHVFSTSHDSGVICVWDADSGNRRRTFKGNLGPVNSIDYSPDGGMLVSAGDDGSIRLWKLKEDPAFLGVTDDVRGLHLDSATFLPWMRTCTFSPDGEYLLAGYDDGRIRLVDLDSGETTTDFAGLGEFVECLAFSTDGNVVAACDSDGGMILWATSTGNIIYKGSWSAPTDDWLPYRMSVCDRGRCVLLSGRYSNDPVLLWDVERPNSSPTTVGSQESRAIATFLSNDGQQAFIWDSDSLRQLNLQTSSEQVLREAPDVGQFQTAFINARVGAALVADRYIEFWNAAGKCSQVELRGDTGDITCLSMTTDHRRIVTGHDDGELRIWDSISGEELFSIHAHRESLDWIQMSPDGARFITKDMNNRPRLWELEATPAD